MLDTLCHEYGWPYDYSIRLPLATAFALYAAIKDRHGVEDGPSFGEDELIDQLNAAKDRGEKIWR